MNVGDLVRWDGRIDHGLLGDRHPFMGKVGLVVGIVVEPAVKNAVPPERLSDDLMFEILFIGQSLTRWVHSKDCEVVDESR